MTVASEYGATRLFDTERLRSVLDTLVHRLADRGVEGRIYLVGGAAMALAYYDEGERRMTADVDDWFTPVDAVDEEATAMAVELGLAGDWLNEGAVQFVPAHGLPDGTPLFKHGEFAVEVGSPRLLLAMKLRAARLGRDNDDIAVLLRRCGVRSVEEARAVLDDCYDGEDRFTEKSRAIVEAALGEYPVLSAIPPFTLPPVNTGDSGS